MRKFSFKKIAALLAAALGITAFSAAAVGCVPKSSDLSEPENIEITKTAPPDDGSLPTAHTCAENLAYINYVFERQTQYHSYSYGVTSASIATQTTRTFRDYKDGVLLTTDLTYSAMVKSGSQTCTVVNVDGEPEVYFRVSEAPEANTLPSQAEWNESAPTIFTERAYHYTYGLLPTELFNYIVNEQNIVKSEEVKVNSDGTYTQSFTLDPVASTYFYQFGMKTRGGLSGYPEFESITFSVTFDGSWRILSSDMHEVAKVNKGIVVSSISDFSTEYWYGDDHFDSAHYAYYDSYFKKFVGDASLEQGGSPEEKPVIDVPNVLSNGFSQIMNGGAQYEISLDLGKNTYKGFVFISLDLADPLETLALKLSLGKSLDKQNLFLEYGNGDMSVYYGKDFALGANLAEVKLAAEGFGSLIENITAAFTPEKDGQPALQEDGEAADPLSELMNSMELTAGEKQAVLTLDTDDLLGLGIGVNARIVFGINGNQISFRGATLGGLTVGGEEVDLGVTLLTTTQPEITIPKGDGANLADYVADVYNLLGSDLVKVDLGLHGSDDKVVIGALKNIDADVTAYADLDGVAVGAQAKVSYNYNGNLISAEASLWYGYNAADGDYGNAVLCLTKLNGAEVDVKLNCNVKQLADAISTAVTFAGGQQNAGTLNLVSLLNGALSSDFSSLLTEMYADKAQIKIGVSVDTVLDMLGVKAGVKFGSCTLKYERGEDIYGGKLSANLPALGFNLTVSGAEGGIETPDTTDSLDLVYVVEDIMDIASADLITANIVLDGSAEGVTLSALDGVYANLDVLFNAQSIAVGADAEISYTYGEYKVSVKLSATYADGNVAIGLNEINGVGVAAKVYCNIDEITEAVTALLEYADVQTKPFEKGTGLELTKIISDLLAADFNRLIPALYTEQDSLNISLDCDELLEILNVDLGISMGKLSLAYTHGGENLLVANAPALGLSVGLNGASGKVEMPELSGYLNLADLVNTVSAVWKQVDGIIDGQSVAFEIEKGNTFLSLDGINVDIWGEGEISWKKGAEYVALDLGMSITELGTDVTELKLIYDKNAEDTPLVRLALNGVGIDIYKDDIDSVTAGFNKIYNKILPLIGGESAQPEQISVLAETEKDAADDKLMSLIFSLISNDGWVDFLNGFTLTSDGKSVALGYMSDNAASVEISADGCLSLHYDGTFGERFSLGGGITVTPVGGTLIGAIEEKLQSVKMSSSKDEGSAEFMRLAYNFLFEAISGIDVSNILGSNTYTVTFVLNGANTNIEELNDVFIDAKIYITGQKGEQGKLAEGDLNINAKGVVINLNVITERRGDNTHFYIDIRQVMDVKLPDLKLLATQDSLYDTIKVAISAVNDTNVIDLLSGIIGGGNDAPAEKVEDTKIDGDTLDLIANVVSKLLDFNFSQAVSGTEADGVTTATIDLDNIVKQLGYKTGALGTVEAVINHNNHSMTTVGKTMVTDENGNSELKGWISLSSELAARKDYSGFDRGEYISIEFLPDLISDIVKTVTDDGKVNDKFTLSGNVNAVIDIKVYKIVINLDITTLTVNLNGENGLYFSLIANLSGDFVSTRTIGLTYQNGYLTLGRNLNTQSPEYRVMTFDYFLEMMFDSDGEKSTLNWLLGIGDFVWGIAGPAIKNNVNMETGLTTPEQIYLYNGKAQKADEEISMYSYVDALKVIVDGNRTAMFGTDSALAAMENDLGVNDNYYGFALNAAKVTGGVLSKLTAGITRNDNGLDRVIAKGALGGIMTFGANLQFKKEWKEDYVIGTANEGGKSAPSLYDSAMGEAEKAGQTPDFDHFVSRPNGKDADEVFGCFYVTGTNSGYTFKTEYLYPLYSHTLTVVDIDGSIEERLVRHGSTVYLYDNDHPVFNQNKTERILYSLSQDSVGGSKIEVTDDVTVYAVARKAVTVIVHSGTEEYTVSSFAGDAVPTSVTGLESLETPTYEDGTLVGQNDKVTENDTVIHIYGKFVKSEIVVNYVTYTFKDGAYAATGRAAGFNDYYSTKGNTLVLENEIGGFPVTAIAANAFANTEGKPIVSIVAPENVVTVGENAFLDNVGMKQAVFLAENVTFLGKDGNNKTMPFYGCSVEGNDEKTALNVYYKNITASGGKWNHFRYVNKVISYNFYIGNSNNGGKTYSNGQWEYTDYKVTVDLNGVNGGTLTKEAVEKVLSPYFPYVTANTYSGSAYEATVNGALENALANMGFTRGGITYMCDYTVSSAQADGKVILTFGVTYKKTAEIYVNSVIAFNLYGNEIAAGEYVLISVPVDGDDINLPVPTHATHKLDGWTIGERDGKPCYTANWTEKTKYTLTVKISKGLTDNNNIYVNGENKGKNVTPTIQVYEGSLSISVDNSTNRVYISDSANTYYIEVKELSLKGLSYKESGKLRAVSTADVGDRTVSDNLTITITY